MSQTAPKNTFLFLNKRKKIGENVNIRVIHQKYWTNNYHIAILSSSSDYLDTRIIGTTPHPQNSFFTLCTVLTPLPLSFATSRMV